MFGLQPLGLYQHAPAIHRTVIGNGCKLELVDLKQRLALPTQLIHDHIADYAT